jgi:hypothetical protein
MKRYYAAATAMVIGLVGCAVNPVTDEKTGPKVVFNQGDKTTDELFLKPDKATPAKFGPESFTCVATDPGGVKSISLSYLDNTTLCVYSSGCGTASPFCIGTGGNISPAILAPQSETSHPDYLGQVPSALLLLATLKEEAYECSDTGGGKTVHGEPFGQTIKVTCTATNYSEKTSIATLPVTFDPPTGAPCCTGSPCNCGGKSSSTKVNVCCAGHVCQSNGSCEKPK